MVLCETYGSALYPVVRETLAGSTVRSASGRSAATSYIWRRAVGTSSMTDQLSFPVPSSFSRMLEMKDGRRCQFMCQAATLLDTMVLGPKTSSARR